ncbi:sensory neuron membrane protein 2-like isoform X1 [Microplitis mediator]|uniref:sensory neuron membrane protein 2-like isoform X1 n=2 Tax=Microplitis mediator TaxID=375433 RepID=UPI002557ACF4|nr:sensory neuron membrane protein 2-like isoform X1 [Microplitis mediator]
MTSCRTRFRNFLSYVPGLVLISLGIYLATEKPHTHYVINQIREEAELVEGRYGYEIWKDLDIYFKVRLYHITNPENVMEGENPIIEERGPYVYNLNMKKRVTHVDEKLDEMAFTIFRTYQFNKSASGSFSEDDQVVLLNSAYLGTLNTIATKFPAFIGRFGNSIHNLFPKTYDVFLRGKVKDILFDGLPLICDPVKYKDLAMLCNFLKGKKPPIIKDTDKPGVYSYSLFDKNNYTDSDPFTVNRGVENKDALGNTTSYKNLRITKYWSEKECNVVSGTDSITWAPMTEKLPFVSVYEPNICRRMTPNFKREVIVNGLMGYRYELDETTWLKENMGCYCLPNAKKVPECLQTGLLEITKCQDAPVIFSEPHFLHADPNLLEYARGLKPDPIEHTTFITIEPLSGAPLSGSKKIQLNLNLQRIPGITLLANVSEGLFPILWAEEANVARVELLGPVINAHRLLNVFKYFTWIPIVIGIFLITKQMWYRSLSEPNDTLNRIQVTTITTTALRPEDNNFLRQPNQQLALIRPANRNRNRVFNK